MDEFYPIALKKTNDYIRSEISPWWFTCPPTSQTVKWIRSNTMVSTVNPTVGTVGWYSCKRRRVTIDVLPALSR